MRNDLQYEKIVSVQENISTFTQKTKWKAVDKGKFSQKTKTSVDKEMTNKKIFTNYTQCFFDYNYMKNIDDSQIDKYLSTYTQTLLKLLKT